MDWPGLTQELAPLRRRWDLPVLASLAGGAMRPADLIKTINSQAGNDRAIGWKVLTDTLRRLEVGGHVARRQVAGVPRQTWYGLRPPGQRLLAAVAVPEAWYRSNDTAAGTGPG
jgi:DNA-binding HxlR family transcriptional regulator